MVVFIEWEWGKQPRKVMREVMVVVWVHPVSEFVIHDQAIGDEEQKDYQVQEKYVKKATIVDISGKLICLEEVRSNFFHQVHYINDLVSLGSQLFVGLHRELMRIRPHFQGILDHVILLFDLFLSFAQIFWLFIIRSASFDLHFFVVNWILTFGIERHVTG